MERKAEFFESAKKVSKKLKNWIDSGNKIRVTSHLDADGLSAAGIIGKALVREGANFQIRIIRQLEKDFVLDLKKEKTKHLIFSDMGAGQIKLLKEHLPDKEIIILDHHKPVDPDYENLVHLNPHHYELACYDYYEALELYRSTNKIPVIYKPLPRELWIGNKRYDRLIDLMNDKGKELFSWSKD